MFLWHRYIVVFFHLHILSGRDGHHSSLIFAYSDLFLCRLNVAVVIAEIFPVSFHDLCKFSHQLCLFLKGLLGAVNNNS